MARMCQESVKSEGADLACQEADTHNTDTHGPVGTGLNDTSLTHSMGVHRVHVGSIDDQLLSNVFASECTALTRAPLQSYDECMAWAHVSSACRHGSLS